MWYCCHNRVLKRMKRILKKTWQWDITYNVNNKGLFKKMAQSPRVLESVVHVKSYMIVLTVFFKLLLYPTLFYLKGARRLWLRFKPFKLCTKKWLISKRIEYKIAILETIQLCANKWSLTHLKVKLPTNYLLTNYIYIYIYIYINRVWH